MFVNLHHASDPLSTHSFASVGLPRRYESLLYNAKSEVQKEEAIGIRKMGEGEGGQRDRLSFQAYRNGRESGAQSIRDAYSGVGASDYQ